MTLLYNATHWSINKYLIKILYNIKYDMINKINWHSINGNNLQLKTDDNYTRLLVSYLENIILNDLENITKIN